MNFFGDCISQINVFVTKGYYFVFDDEVGVIDQNIIGVVEICLDEVYHVHLHQLVVV